MVQVVRFAHSGPAKAGPLTKRYAQQSLAMRKITVAILFLLMTTTANAGAGLWGLRGELWQQSNESQKFMYVQGMLDGLIFSEFTIHGTKVTTSIDSLQYTKAIDALYADYRNQLIPVPFLMRIITLELSGEKSSTIDEELTSYRAKFAIK